MTFSMSTYSRSLCSPLIVQVTEKLVDTCPLLAKHCHLTSGRIIPIVRFNEPSSNLGTASPADLFGLHKRATMELTDASNPLISKFLVAFVKVVSSGSSGSGSLM